MKSLASSLCIALLAGGALFATTGAAFAYHDRNDRHDPRSVHRDFRAPNHAWGPGNRHAPAPVVVSRPGKRGVVVHEIHHYHPAPPPGYYGARHYAPPRHAAPPRHYAPPPHSRSSHNRSSHNRYPTTRQPAVVINFPSVVIPVR